MKRRRGQPDQPDQPDQQGPSSSELHRAPIITEHLIVREATRSDARPLEATMDAAGLTEAGRTTDGARRFGAGLAEVPVWSATRAVCEKGSARIVGGVVITDVADPEGPARRIGWWLAPDAEPYSIELLAGVVDRARATGAHRIVVHVRADDDRTAGTVEAAGFRRGAVVRHTAEAGGELEFHEYALP